MIRFDAVLILGKEMRQDPERALRELRARAAAAAAVHRATGARVMTLEAGLRGQEQTGSAIVQALLDELAVPREAVHREERTCSTRDEIVTGLARASARRWGRLLVVTSRYHVPRTRRHVDDERRRDATLRVSVHTPAALLRLASERERQWILAGEPDARTMWQECTAEAVLSALARAVRPLPFRAALEVRAGEWWRGSQG